MTCDTINNNNNNNNKKTKDYGNQESLSVYTCTNMDDGGSEDCDDVVFDAREVESYRYSRL